uniref:Uncharacterized protein n=1 Tax=Panagrolaimus superbus TaxID=310955 RepID=A0A914YNL5_9BILA
MFPRAGRRQEGEGYLNLEWRPVDFLTLNAGVRYSRYWAFDDFLQAHPELLTKGVGSKEATLPGTNELPERPASLQAEIDALEAEREFWESIGMGSVIDDALHGLLAYYETPQAWTSASVVARCHGTMPVRPTPVSTARWRACPACCRSTPAATWSALSATPCSRGRWTGAMTAAAITRGCPLSRPR